MTILIPTPKSVALGAVRHAADRVRELLATLLAPAPSRSRHYAPSALQILWQRCKSALSYCATTTLQTRPVRHPDQLATPRREPLDTPGSSPLQSPTRTAQPHEEVRPNDHHWHDQPIPPSACTTTADLAIDWPPVIDWPTAEPELRADHTDTGFAGYFAKPAVVKPAFAESTVVKSAVLEPLVPEPAVAESAVLVTVVEQTAVLEAVEETAVLETLVEQTVVLEAVVEDATPGEYTTDWEYTLGEYTPGDLARWYDEAAARLDAEIGTNFASRPW